jgi:hypothetical protein
MQWTASQFSSLPREKLLCYNRDPFTLAATFSVVFLILGADSASRTTGLSAAGKIQEEK